MAQEFFNVGVRRSFIGFEMIDLEDHIFFLVIDAFLLFIQIRVLSCCS